jgi:thymidine phosphorylase
MNKKFDDTDLTDDEVQGLISLALHGDVPASVIILARMAETLAVLPNEQLADLSLAMGACGDYIEVAISNVNVWYRDEFPEGIDRAVTEAKFSTINAV